MVGCWLVFGGTEGIFRVLPLAAIAGHHRTSDAGSSGTALYDKLPIQPVLFVPLIGLLSGQIRGLACGRGGGSGLRLWACGHPNVAHVANHFEDFTAGWEHSPVGTFVGVQGLHELDFVSRIVAFARGRIDLTASLHLASLRSPALQHHRSVLLAPIVALSAILRGTAVHDDFGVLGIGHFPVLPRSAIRESAAVGPQPCYMNVQSENELGKSEKLGKIFGYSNMGG